MIGGLAGEEEVVAEDQGELMMVLQGPEAGVSFSSVVVQVTFTPAFLKSKNCRHTFNEFYLCFSLSLSPFPSSPQHPAPSHSFVS